MGTTTIALLVLKQFFSLRHLNLVYLIPVVIVTTKLGIVPAVIAAIASVGATVFFFYPPIYSFLVEISQHLIELSLFGFVVIVIGHLATISGDEQISQVAVKPKCENFTVLATAHRRRHDKGQLRHYSRAPELDRGLSERSRVRNGISRPKRRYFSRPISYLGQQLPNWFKLRRSRLRIS